MQLDLDDEQAALLLAELDRIIEDDRYPLSARVRALLKPYPERPPPPAPAKRYEPPSRGQYRKRR